jgi:hypothetical protein
MSSSSVSTFDPDACWTVSSNDMAKLSSGQEKEDCLYYYCRVSSLFAKIFPEYSAFTAYLSGSVVRIHHKGAENPL